MAGSCPFLFLCTGWCAKTEYFFIKTPVVYETGVDKVKSGRCNILFLIKKQDGSAVLIIKMNTFAIV